MLKQVGEDGVGFGSDFDGARIPAGIGNAAGLQNLVEVMRARGFGEPLIDRAVAPHFTGGEIAQPDAQPHRCVLRDAAAHPDLEIVGMRAEYEEIRGVHQAIVLERRGGIGT